MHRKLLSALLLCGAASSLAWADGFQVNRYEPTAAGEWSLAVDHPWYSRSFVAPGEAPRHFSAGLTLNYGHLPLRFRHSDAGAPIQHQLLGHVDLAGSFLDRVLVSASLPITFLERGVGLYGVSPLDNPTAGDPRLGLLVRLYGQPYRDPFSVSLGGSVWLPVHGDSAAQQVSDTGVRVQPKLVVGGLWQHVLWSANASFYFRPESTIGQPPAGVVNTSASELQFGAAVKYASLQERLALGPELLVSTQALGAHAFERASTSLDLLLGVHYNLAGTVQVSAGGGVGLLKQPGTADGRVLLRLAYAPMAVESRRAPEPVADRDADQVPDGEDACPDVRGVASADPKQRGCPADQDQDGVADAQDLCPTQAAGGKADPERLGCPLTDRDGDGVADRGDICPAEPAGAQADPERPGCPLIDQDGDGVFDKDDVCAKVPQGAHPDPARRGCPDQDRDGDGVYDSADACPTVAAGLQPDPRAPGCPQADSDGDSVPDAVDACPKRPGAPSAEPKRNGCPGLVEVKQDQIVIKQQVFFASGKDEILPRSFPLLKAVVEVLRATPAIRKVLIEGHTDNSGDAAQNTELSERRARSVQRYLTEAGVAAERLTAQGFGPARPIADNATDKGRAKNRRVDFRITATAPPAP